MAELSDQLREQLLLAEFAEAWSHYRHIESTRQQYLSLFFSLLVGVFGLTATLAPNVDLGDPASLLGVVGVLWALSLFSTLLYTNIRKMGRVLRGYEESMAFVRRTVYQNEYEDYYRGLSVRATDDPIMKMRVYRVQMVGEWVLGSCALAFAAALLWLVVVQWTDSSAALRGVLSVALLSCGGLIVYALLAPPLQRAVMNRTSA